VVWGLGEKVGFTVCPYALRHAGITEAVDRPVAAAAERRNFPVPPESNSPLYYWAAHIFPWYLLTKILSKYLKIRYLQAVLLMLKRS
jgi:hypothetical protein